MEISREYRGRRPAVSTLRSLNNFKIEQSKFGIVFERPGKKIFLEKYFSNKFCKCFI